MERKKDLICFDMDGTILKSDRAHALAYNKALQTLGFPKKKSSFIVSLFGRPHEEVAMFLLPSFEKYNYKLIEKLTKFHDKFIFKKYFKYSKTLPYVKKVLEKLKKYYNLALLSNCNKKVMRALLKTSGIKPKTFKILIGADKVSCSKPCPAEIVKAEKLMNKKPIFMVGDSIYDIMAANNAGVKGIGVLTGKYSRARLKKAGAYRTIKDLRGTLKILKVK